MELPLSLAKLLHILGINVGDTRVEDYSWPSREARPLWSVRLALQDHIHTAGNCIDRLRSLLRAMSKQSNTEMSEKTKLIIDELENSIDAIEGELYP